MSLPLNATPKDMIDLAEAWLREAEDSIFNEERGGWSLAQKANKLRTRAAKMMPVGPELLSLLLDIAFLACNLDDHRRVCWAVRKAIECDPDESQRDDLKEYWEGSSWSLKGDKSFPEPPAEVEKPWKPAPGQMSFLGDT